LEFPIDGVEIPRRADLHYIVGQVIVGLGSGLDHGWPSFYHAPLRLNPQLAKAVILAKPRWCKAWGGIRDSG
jgi:hypothetical protein